MRQQNEAGEAASEWVPISQAARRLSISRAKANRDVISGRIPSEYVNRALDPWQVDIGRLKLRVENGEIRLRQRERRKGLALEGSLVSLVIRRHGRREHAGSKTRNDARGPGRDLGAALEIAAGILDCFPEYRPAAALHRLVVSQL